MNIFSSGQIQALKFKNRIIRSATHEGMADSSGHPLAELGKYYLRLAEGGVGGIITGFTGTQKNGKAVPLMRMFDSDEFIDDYRDIASSMKRTGTPLIMQLAHGGGLSSRKIMGEKEAAPSSVKYKTTPRAPRELSADEITGVISNFIKAIERSRNAGFDGVQIHAAHGYLLAEFLSPYSNRRTDAWGGSREKRARIVTDIIKGAREKVGAYPILAKISGYELRKGGLSVDDAVENARLLQEAGCDAIEVSCGGVDDGMSSVRVERFPREAAFAFIDMLQGLPWYKKRLMSLMLPVIYKAHRPLLNYNVEAAKKIKAGVDIPVIVVGGIRAMRDMEGILSSKSADFIAMARPFICEPDIVKKFMEGTSDSSRCVNCGFCLMRAQSGRIRCYMGKSGAVSS